MNNNIKKFVVFWMMFGVVKGESCLLYFWHWFGFFFILFDYRL